MMTLRFISLFVSFAALLVLRRVVVFSSSSRAEEEEALLVVNSIPLDDNIAASPPSASSSSSIASSGIRARSSPSSPSDDGETSEYRPQQQQPIDEEPLDDDNNDDNAETDHVDDDDDGDGDGERSDSHLEEDEIPSSEGLLQQWQWTNDGPLNDDDDDDAETDHHVIEEEPLPSSGIPVYLLGDIGDGGDAPSSSSSAVVRSLDYRHLASVWDRDTHYDDLLRRAVAASSPSTDAGNNTSSSAEDELRRKLLDGNRDVTILFHTSPKTGSSTLRAACLETQYDTCNLPHKREGMKWPEGYKSPIRLLQLFDECPDTRHFCVKEQPLTGGYAMPRRHPSPFESRTFLHLFPFRNYDEWTRSALHQISYRDGEDGCRETSKLLRHCRPHKFELNFDRYAKVILANFVKSLEALKSRVGSGGGGGGNNGDDDDDGARAAAARREAVTARHHLLVHDYTKLDETLKMLYELFNVPLLPGTGHRVNSVRPEESCIREERLLDRFHECFSHELAGLY